MSQNATVELPIYILKWVDLYGGKKRVPGLHLKMKFGSFYDDLIPNMGSSTVAFCDIRTTKY